MDDGLTGFGRNAHELLIIVEVEVAVLDRAEEVVASPAILAR